MSKHFWRGFWLGANPFCWLSELLFWCGHFVSLLMNKSELFGGLYPVYNWLMIASLRIQLFFNLDEPWEKSFTKDNK